MSQHDMVIDNNTGRNVRLDINDALAALVSNSSGTAAPTTTFPFMWWADTTNGLLKIRNAANNAWVSLGDLTTDGFGSLSKAGGTMTGAILAALGTLTAPGLSFAGSGGTVNNTKTGMAVLTTGQLSLIASAVEAMTLLSTNVNFKLPMCGSSADDSTSGSAQTLAAVATPLVRLTAGGTLTSINGIPAGYAGQLLFLSNATGASITINDETGATTANRIRTGLGTSFILKNNATVVFVYDTTSSRWRVNSSAAGTVAVSDIPAPLSSATDLRNAGIAASVSGGALTVAVKQADGSTDPSTAAASVIASMRDTVVSGAFLQRIITAALSGALSSGTTLGMPAAQDFYLWAYLIDSDGAGTMKVGLSTILWDDMSLQSATKEAATATYSHLTSTWTETGHNRANNDAVVITAGTSVPSGFTAGTKYFVISSATNTYQLSASPGGSVVSATTNDGTGTQTVHVADARIASDGYYSSKAIRPWARFKFNLVTAGTWIAPTEVSLATEKVYETQKIEAFVTCSQSTSMGTAVLIPYDGAVRDSLGCVVLGSGFKYVVQKAGTLRMKKSFFTGATTTLTRMLFNPYINGVDIGQIIAIAQTGSTTNQNTGAQGALDWPVNRGDLVDIRGTSTSTLTLAGQTDKVWAQFTLA